MPHAESGANNDGIGEDEERWEKAGDGEDADDSAAGHEHGEGGNHVGLGIDGDADGGGKENSTGDDDGRNGSLESDSGGLFLVFAV